MKCDISSGSGAIGAATVATTTVDVLETPPGGGLQASIKSLTEFTNQAAGKDVPDSVKQALRRIKGKGNDS